jgi:Tol biopolymer transport system component
VGKSGLRLRKENVWEISVRESQVVYLASVDQKVQLWVVGMDGRAPRQLTKFDKTIFDFDVAPDGEYLVLSGINEKQGSDLWYLDRSGLSLRLLLDCGADRCTTPAVSPDSQQVAYTRESAPLNAAMPYGAPRTWVLNVQSGEDHALYSDPQVIGYGPGWSPDGKRITSFDGIQDLLLVVAPESGERVTLPNNVGGPLSWSADGSRLLFTNVEPGINGLRTVVKMADFSTGEVTDVIGARDERDYQYGALAWSPTSDQVVLGLQSDANNPSESLLLMDLGLTAGQAVANEPDVSYHAPRWNLWGTALLFQQFRLKGSYAPEIALWMPGFPGPRVLAQGLSPHWLP